MLGGRRVEIRGLGVRRREASGGALDSFLFLCRARVSYHAAAFLLLTGFAIAFVMCFCSFVLVYSQKFFLLPYYIDGGVVGEVRQSRRRGDMSRFSRESCRRRREVTKKNGEIQRDEQRV